MNVYIANMLWQIPQIPTFCPLASKIVILNSSPLQGRGVNRLPCFACRHLLKTNTDLVTLFCSFGNVRPWMIFLHIQISHMHPAIGTKFSARVYFCQVAAKFTPTSENKFAFGETHVDHVVSTNFFTVFISWNWRRQTWCEHNSHNFACIGSALGQRFSVFKTVMWMRNDRPWILDRTRKINTSKHIHKLYIFDNDFSHGQKWWWKFLGSKLTEQWF